MAHFICFLCSIFNNTGLRESLHSVLIHMGLYDPLGVATADHLPPSPRVPYSLLLSHQSFTTSMNLLYSLPRFLLICSTIFKILCLIQSLSLLCTCSDHLNLACPTLSTELFYSFLIFSILVTMIEIHSTPNSATPVCFSSLSVPQSPDQNNFLLNF